MAIRGGRRASVPIPSSLVTPTACYPVRPVIGLRQTGEQEGAVLRGGVGLGTLIYVIIGAFVAGANDYFDRLGNLKGILSALLAIGLWPLVLLGIDLQVK